MYKRQEQYERFVFTICYQLVRDYQEAQNLAQDTFVSAFGHIDRVSEENLKAWLARIATNKAKDFLKSAYRRKVSVSEDMSELDIVRSEQSPERLYICLFYTSIYIFFEPTRKRHMPTPPKFCNAAGNIGIVEVLRKCEAEHFAKADCHQRITGKIKIDLKCKSSQAKPG